MREEDKTPEEQLSEVELSNLPDKEFKVMIIKMLRELGRRMDEQSNKFNKELENIKKNQRKVKNTITEKKIYYKSSIINEMGQRNESEN